MALTREATRGSTDGKGGEAKKESGQSDVERAAEDATPDLPQEDEAATSWTVQKLWQDTNQEHLAWLSEPPVLQNDNDNDADAPQHAITLLHRDIRRTGKHTLDSIVMRGAELRQLLEDNVPDASSYYDESEQGVIMKAPFRLLFWHIDQLKAASEKATGENKRASELLLSVLNDEFRPLVAKRDRVVAQREIFFDVLWTLYKPGITCLTRADEDFVAVKLTSINFSKDPLGKIYYRINHDTLVWDGQHFGWNDSYTDVYEFSGRRKILDLEVYPIEFHTDKSVIDQLVARGRRFAEIAIKEPFLMSFNGEALDRESSPMWWQGAKKKKV